MSIIFVFFFDILLFCSEKAEPSFLHTFTAFWLDRQGLGPLGGFKKREKQ